MKFTAIVFTALAALATASPDGRGPPSQCTPACSVGSVCVTAQHRPNGGGGGNRPTNVCVSILGQCAGIAGRVCPSIMRRQYDSPPVECIDDPRDDCSLEGGADCG